MADPHTQVMDFLLTQSSTRTAFVDEPEQTIRPDRRPRTALGNPVGPRVVPDDAVVLGRGGMGVVLGGRQTRLSRDIAVKTLHEQLRDDDEAREALLLEALVTGALEHPAIVPVYDIDDDGHGLPLIALKRIEGVPWSKRMRDADAARDAGVSDLLEWNLHVVIRVCEALEYAHSRGIIHRDIKPANVMVGRFGEVYVLDWGLAVACRDDVDPRFPRATEAAGIVGTPAYMAPELLQRDLPRQGPATDVYLVGAVLYHLLVGRVPHVGRELHTLLDSVLRGPAPMPPETPPALVRLVQQCMALDPAQRPDVAHVKQAVADFLARRGVERVVDAARAATDALAALAQHTTTSRDDVQRAVRLYAEARFGFRQARGPGADDAVLDEQLERALRAAVHVALAGGSPDVATAFVAESERTPKDVGERVRMARERAEADLRALRATAHDADLFVGRRSRAWLIIGVGLPAALNELWLHVNVVARGHARSYEETVGAAALFLAIGAIGRVVMHRRLTNAISRKFWNIAVSSLFGLVVMRAAFMHLQVPIELCDTFAMFIWWLGAMSIVNTIDARLVPAAVVYLACFVAALRWPSVRLLLHGASHLTLMANAWWAWVMRPRDLPRTTTDIVDAQRT